MTQIVWILFLFTIINLLIISFIDKFIIKFNIYDLPNTYRKFHIKKTSLIGGSIILFNLIFFLLLDTIFKLQSTYGINKLQLLIGSLSYYLLGLYDDKKDLNANLKFILEIFITYLIIKIDKSLLINDLYFLSFDLRIYLGNYSMIFTILCIVIFINAFNMLDGINLQCGFYSLFIFFSFFNYIENNLLLIIILISIICFLFLNFKSKVFLGDNGTYLLGFLISYLVIISSKNLEYSKLSADKIFLLMILPGLELIRLIIYRSINKKHPFAADRRHIHHILLENFSESKTIIILILFSFFSILLSVLINEKILLAIFLFITLYFFIIKTYAK